MRLSTRTHGVADYLSVGVLIALPRLLNFPARATQLMTMLGLGTLAYSLLTRYELGARKVLPFKAHLALDTASAATLCATPLLLRGEDPAAVVAMVALGISELAITLSTETETPADRSLRSRLLRRIPHEIMALVRS